MGASWHALHADLVRSATTLSFQRAFEGLRRSYPTLAEFPDPAAMLDHLHDPAHHPEGKNAILRALGEAAQSPEQLKEPVTLLLLALWPGLDAAHRRLRPIFQGDPDTLATELVSRLAVAVHDLDLSRVNRIAATLLRNLERDIRRDHAAHQRGLAAAAKDRVEQPNPDAANAYLEERLLARQIVRLLGENDAFLVLAIALTDKTQAEAADRLGLGREAAKKRFQRARDRLRRCREDFF